MPSKYRFGPSHPYEVADGNLMYQPKLAEGKTFEEAMEPVCEALRHAEALRSACLKAYRQKYRIERLKRGQNPDA